MVEGFKKDQKLLREVAKIYEWLEMELSDKLPCKCDACGKCCDFAEFDHRLYVTIPEIMYLASNLNVQFLKQMSDNRCPYNIDGKCVVYNYRFSACRIFNCKGDTNIQSEISESALKKIKTLCNKYEIPYRYMDLDYALNNQAQV